ncbi:MAG: peptidylprolyl isomerase [Citromicrobium sp.]|nr:peptidylprolyl isomerase [Citromicrobium sp.]
MLRQGALALAALALAAPGVAQDAVRSPGEIVATAPSRDWVTIAPQDLLVMTLAPDAEGNARKVVIQLIGAPFSQGWVDNIRTLAKAKYWDGMAILRVQDNYVVQWGQPDPGMGIAEKPVPEGLKVMDASDYVAQGKLRGICDRDVCPAVPEPMSATFQALSHDSYAGQVGFADGWPVASFLADSWPIHCYGMVGVGRGNPPDTGDGSQLYAVIGHAPRHLDRNLAVVGRVVEGIEHLSSLPRGKGPASYYADPAKRVPILSVRIAADLPASERPHLEYLSTESDSFAQYADARANRRDPFFVASAGGADICNIPVPIRSVAE